MAKSFPITLALLSLIAAVPSAFAFPCSVYESAPVARLTDTLTNAFGPYGYDSASAKIVEAVADKTPQIGAAFSGALKAYVTKPSTATRIDALVVVSVIQAAMPEPKSSEEKGLIGLLTGLEQVRESLAAQQCESAPTPAPAKEEEKKSF